MFLPPARIGTASDTTTDVKMSMNVAYHPMLGLALLRTLHHIAPSRQSFHQPLVHIPRSFPRPPRHPFVQNPSLTRGSSLETNPSRHPWCHTAQGTRRARLQLSLESPLHQERNGRRSRLPHKPPLHQLLRIRTDRRYRKNQLPHRSLSYPCCRGGTEGSTVKLRLHPP